MMASNFRQLTQAVLKQQSLKSAPLLPLLSTVTRRLERPTTWSWLSDSVRDDIAHHVDLLAKDQVPEASFDHTFNRMLAETAQEARSWSARTTFLRSAELEQTMPAVAWLKLVSQIQQRSDSDQPTNLLYAMEDVGNFLQGAVFDAKAITLEKLGVTSAVSVDVRDEFSPDRQYLVQPASLSFAVQEILKNALASHHRKYGTDADLAPFVTVALHEEGSSLNILANDNGEGMTLQQQRVALHWFSSTVEESEPTYTFSGNFGGQLEGKGVGLPLARAYLRAMDGDASLLHSDIGQTVRVVIPVCS
eukprot:m.262094 g.262094  ORF g.262094 m.262094 type:complete len:305 (-) comp17605_c0_seq24:6130-7044(-)